MLRLLPGLVVITAMLPAQQPRGPVRVLLGSQIVDGDSRLVTGTIPIGRDYPRAEPVASWQWEVAGRFVDTKRGDVLTITPERVVLATLDTKERWSVERRATHTALAVGTHQCVLAGDRIVMPAGGDGGGLVALDRTTGAIVWERPKLPNGSLVAGDDLVVATGSIDGKPRLAALAIANGARAFDVPLATMPGAVVVASHGVAVVGDTAFTVFDRSGPELFRVAERPVALVANADGWIGASWKTVTAWSRTGEVKWTAPVAVGDFEQIALAPLADGGVVHLRYMGMADSGFDAVCCDARGDVVWRRTEPGLGIAHSKYWHRVAPFVDGDRLFVASQGAGGCFLVELDPASGDRAGRAIFEMK